MIRALFGKTGITLAMALCLVATCLAARSAATDLVGQPAPLFTGKTLEGAVVTLEDLRGKVVVVDFWAKWCSHCRRALPKVQTVASRFEKDAVKVLGVNMDADLKPEEIRFYLDWAGVKFDQMLDPEGYLSERYGVSSIPCLFVIDKQGVVRFVHTGDAADLAEQIGAQVTSLL